MKRSNVQLSKITILSLLVLASLKLQAQKTVNITSTVLIDAPIKDVYSLIKDFERFLEWSPSF